MEANFAAITIFTLLFAVSTARISDLQALHTIKNNKVQDSNLAFVPTDTNKKSKSTHDQTEKVNNVDLTPRPDLAKIHAINRRFFNEPRLPLAHRPYKIPILIPRSKISDDNVLTDVERQDSSLKCKQRNRHRIHDEVSVAENKVKRREREAEGFMKSIRKFLKHTFD
ncbi:hypothetical protein QVD17_28308 [Tagetes erecta]|uniref:Uncharacterized protein n=1 Tax=Tagetes erecta TaxID=13708 RepID=A0AAD8NS03_TARER|nr:hypothetical protein QVD17_28308 [Tagetes erecta]